MCVCVYIVYVCVYMCTYACVCVYIVYVCVCVLKVKTLNLCVDLRVCFVWACVWSLCV